MERTEHILLESDERVLPTLETARKVHARLELRGDFWRRWLNLALIDFFYLSVRTGRAQSVDSRYVVDLRFVDPVPRLERRVAWIWVAVGATCLALGTFGARDVAASAGSWWRHDWFPFTVASFGVAVCALFAAFHLTTETLTLFSANGRARLVSHSGRLGTFRAFRRFLPRLEAHLQIALAARRRSRAQHLRDEMREHFRLRSVGALTEVEYDAAKRRILAAHDPSAARSPKQKARESLPVPSRPVVRA